MCFHRCEKPSSTHIQKDGQSQSQEQLNSTQEYRGFGTERCKALLEFNLMHVVLCCITTPSHSECPASKNMVNANWIRRERKLSRTNLRYYLAVCWDRLRKITRVESDRHWKSGLPEYAALVISKATIIVHPRIAFKHRAMETMSGSRKHRW